MTSPTSDFKPTVDDDGHTCKIFIPTTKIDFKKASVDHIHYVLNLFDNEVATSFFKLISKGLILPYENHTDYLSFRDSEPVRKEVTGSVLAKDNIDRLLTQHVMKAQKTLTRASDGPHNGPYL